MRHRRDTWLQAAERLEEAQPQVWERPSAAGQPRGERAESRSVTQEMEREINEHAGAGVVTFQERGKEECSPWGRGGGPEGLERAGKEGGASVFSLLAPVLGTRRGAGQGDTGRV